MNLSPRWVADMRLFIFVISILFSASAVASPFHLNCKAKKGVGYRFGQETNGTVYIDEWSDEGSFSSEWNFVYQGSGDIILVDGKESLGFYVNDTIIVTEYAQNGMSQGMWSYAINLVNMEAVASQVNASNAYGHSLKARTVSLECSVM